MRATSFNCSPSLPALTVFPNVRFPGPGGPSAPLRRRWPVTMRFRAALFSAALPSLPPVIVPRERAPYSGRCLSTPWAPGGRDAPVKHPSVASPGLCSPGAGHRPAWACTCRGRGRDERGQRCCRWGASGRARCPGREITPGDSPLKPRGTLPWLRSRFNSRRLQTRGRGPGSGPGGNRGRTPGRWPGQRRAFQGMTPLRGL